MRYKKGMPIRIKIQEEGMCHCHVCGLFINESMINVFNGKCTTIKDIKKSHIGFDLYDAGGWTYCTHIIEPLKNDIREDMGF